MMLASAQLSTERRVEIIACTEACQSAEQIREYARSLNPEERWAMTLADTEKFDFFKNPDGSCKIWTGVTQDTTVAIPFSAEDRDADIEDAKAVYRQLFHIISEALVEARRQDRVLYVNLGEVHVDRGALALELMALDIAHRLGITKNGFETIEKEAVCKTLSGKEVLLPGIDGWEQYLASITRNGKVMETDEASPQPDGTVLNRAVFIPYASKKGNEIFATDGEGISSMESDPAKFFERREKRMFACIERSGNDALHICGTAHLLGMMEEARISKDAYMLSIGVTQKVYLAPPFEFDMNDTKRVQRASAGFRIHPILNGNVRDITHAQRLAQAADRALGEQLARAFFKHHPECGPQETPKIAARGR